MICILISELTVPINGSVMSNYIELWGVYIKNTPHPQEIVSVYMYIERNMHPSDYVQCLSPSKTETQPHHSALATV